MLARRLLALSLLAAAACGRGPSAGPACAHDESQEQAPRLQVLVSPAPTRIRRDLDLAGLARLPGVSGVGAGKLQGLTEVEHHRSFKTKTTLMGGYFGRQACAWIDSLTIDLAPSAVTIYVPSDYPPESCEAEEIMSHERRHEEINRRLLDETAEKVRRALERARWLPARGTPLAVADKAEADRRFEGMIEKITAPLFADFQEELTQQQAVLDLPENYRWVTRRCPNWK